MITVTINRIPSLKDIFRGNQHFIVLLLLYLILVIMLLDQATAKGADGTVKLSVSPDSVALLPGETRNVVVVVSNATKWCLSHMLLSDFSDVGVDVVIDAPAPKKLPAGGSIPWQVKITRLDEGLAEGTLHFRLDFQLQNEEKSDKYVPGVAVTKLVVSERVFDPVDLTKVAELRIDAKLDKLSEKRPRTVYASVINKSSRVVTIQSLQIRHPYFVEVKKPGLAEPIKLQPSETYVFPIEVLIKDKVQSGTYILFFEVGVKWQEKGRLLTATLTHAQDFKPIIIGESAILEISKVPSLLLLPGFLMLTTFLFLWKFFPKTPALMKASEPEYWVFSIALSLVTTYVYPWITNLWVGERRDLLEGYGFKDIVWIWISSLAVGFAAWLMTTVVIAVVRLCKQLAEAKLVFNENDSQADLLRKLAQNDLGLELERGTVQNNTVYKLTMAGEEELWVAPAIFVKWNDNLPLDDQIYNEYLELLGKPDDVACIKKLADLIEKMDPAKAAVVWKHGSGLQRVAVADWKAEQGAGGKPINSMIIE